VSDALVPSQRGVPELDQAMVTTARGRVHDWHDARGTYRDSVDCSFATFEITAIGGERPDGQPVAPLALARSLLSGAAFMPGCDALELRYLAEPQPGGVPRVRMFVTAKSCSEYGAPRLAAAAATAAVAALPPDYVREPVTQRWMSMQLNAGDPIFELRRNEEVTFPTWEYIPADFYYHISGTPGDGAGWKQFWHSLAHVASPVTISILFKQTDLDPEERHVIGAVTTQLAQFAVTRQDFDLLGYQTTYPGDENAAIPLAAWQDRLRLLQRPLLGRIAVRGDYATAMPLATALASAIAESSDPRHVNQPMLVESPYEGEHYAPAYDGFDWLEILPWGGSLIWQEPDAPLSLRRFRYLYGIDEAAGLAMLPVPDEQGVPGFARARRLTPRRAALQTAPTEPSVVLGRILNEGSPIGPACLPLTAINRHALVVGTPGSGKTTTVLTMLTALWRDHHVPFLVIEPTKGEYRTLLDASGMEDLRVICLGRDDVAPIRLNPLEPPPGVRCEVQANALLASLKAALPLPSPLPQLLEDSIDRAYRRAGWDYDTTMEEGLAPPSLRTLMDCFEEAFEAADYRGDALNVGSAMRTRLRGLVRGSRGRVLDTVESTDFDALMGRPVVIEMDEIADPDDKSIMASLILERVRAAARRKGSSEGVLRHVTVIEEAHRLLARLQPSGGAEGEGARAAGVEAFCNAIAELRSVGEGFIISSQSPARLASAAIDNCGTRILHRIESAADRDIVLADLDAGQLEREAASRLSMGEAIARWPQIEEAEIVRVEPGEGVNSGAVVTMDDVRARMAAETTTVRQLLPYALCTREVCANGCDPRIRSEGESVAVEVGGRAAKVWSSHGERTADALPAIAAMVHAEAQGNTQLAYCGATHLAVLGHALNVRRRPDQVRPQLKAAIEAASA
jgi:DNA helicase HerA-like ATPase